MKHLAKGILSLALVLCLVCMGSFSAFALEAGEYTFNGAGEDGGQEIRVEKGGTANVVYTMEYKDSTTLATTGIGSVYFFVKYDKTKMTYTEGTATGSVGVLERNDIINKTTGSLVPFNGQIRITKVALHSTTFKVTIPFTNVQDSDTPVLTPREFFGDTEDPAVVAEFTYVEGTEPTIIMQNPLSVKAGTGGSVSVKTTAYQEGKNTYDASGTDTAVAAGTSDTIYVDSGAGQQNAPVFDITPDENYVLSDIIINERSVGASVVAAAVASGSYTLAGTDVAMENASIAFQFKKNVSFVTVKTETRDKTSNAYVESVAGGTVTYDGSVLPASKELSIAKAGKATFTITPKTGYSLEKLVVDGTALSDFAGKTGESTYELALTDLSADHSITASFTPVPCAITTEVVGEGTISGPVKSYYGDTATFTFTPKDSTYGVKAVWIDGTKLAAMPSYTFESLTGDHTVKVEFEPLVSSIDFTKGVTVTDVDGTQKGTFVLRGDWAQERTVNLLDSILINDSAVTADDVTITVDTDSASENYGFPAGVCCVEQDASVAGQLNIVKSGIIDVVVTAKADPSKSKTFVIVVPGDYNRNGKVDTADATAVVDVVCGDVPLGTRQFDFDMANLAHSVSAELNTADATSVIDLAAGDTTIAPPQ